MLPINVAIVLVTLISSAHAGEQNATVQTDTGPPALHPQSFLSKSPYRGFCFYSRAECS